MIPNFSVVSLVGSLPSARASMGILKRAVLMGEPCGTPLAISDKSVELSPTQFGHLVVINGSIWSAITSEIPSRRILMRFSSGTLSYTASKSRIAQYS